MGVAHLVDDETKRKKQKEQQAQYKEEQRKHQEELRKFEEKINRYETKIDEYQAEIERYEEEKYFNRSLEEMLEENRKWREYCKAEAEPIKISARKKAKELQNNIMIVQSFWNNVHLDLSYRLTSARNQLKLEYKIKNNSGVPWNETECGITLQVRVADSKNRTIWLKKIYITDMMLQLASDKVAGVVWLTDCNLQLASQLWITAQCGDWTAKGE